MVPLVVVVVSDGGASFSVIYRTVLDHLFSVLLQTRSIQAGSKRRNRLRRIRQCKEMENIQGNIASSGYMELVDDDWKECSSPRDHYCFPRLPRENDDGDFAAYAEETVSILWMFFVWRISIFETSTPWLPWTVCCSVNAV